MSAYGSVCSNSCPLRPEEGIGWPEVGVTGNFVPGVWVLGTQLKSPKEQDTRAEGLSHLVCFSQPF